MHFTTSLVHKDTLSKNEDDFKQKSFNLNFHFNPVSTDYISNLLQNIDVKKSCGPYGVTLLLVKKANSVIVEHITMFQLQHG